MDEAAAAREPKRSQVGDVRQRPQPALLVAVEAP